MRIAKTLSFQPYEWELIEKACKRLNLTPSAYVRKLINEDNKKRDPNARDRKTDYTNGIS